MITASKKVLPILISTLLLSACKDSSNNDSNDKALEHHDESETGRLVVSSSGIENGDGTIDTPEIAVLNAQDGALIERFPLVNYASQVYTSPQARFALIAQKDQNQVQIVDGGLYQEDHGDHLHPYDIAPTVMDLTFNGVRPTHFRDNESRSAFFFDGNKGDALMASIVDFDDDEILSGNVRNLELESAMHGTAEPREDYLISTYRNEEKSGADQVELHKFNSDSGNYDFVKRFEELCPGLHGSFSTEEASVFGCKDGVLVISQEGDTFTSSKIVNTAEVTAIAEGAYISGFRGFADSHVIAGYAKGELIAIDLDEKTMAIANWRGNNADAVYSTAAMDDEGTVLMVLNSDGGLHLLDANNNFSHLKTIQVLDGVPELEGWDRISIIPSKASENVYITDPDNNRLVVVNIEHQEVETPIELPFTPKHATWVGVPGETHSHDHGHDHE